jgi:hypothetical protein
VHSPVLASGGGGRDAFAVLVALHVASAIVGFAARHLERPGALGEARRWFATPNRAAMALLAVPFFGVGALLADGRSSELGDAWAVAAIVLWIGLAGLLTGIVRPAEARLRELLAGGGVDVGSGPVDVDAVAGLAWRLSLAAAICDVGFVVALGLMIWQP